MWQGGPFLGLLLSIAVLPLGAPRLWHRGMEWITLFWCACLLLPLAWAAGPAAAGRLALHALLADYVPLITLLLALYVAGGGILLEGGRPGTPGTNTALLAVGTVLAGIFGTTGAAIVLVRPLLRANAHRPRRAHLVVFLILLVANAGGGTTPLGDPPLYIGFLRGVPFFWPLRHLAGPLLVTVLPLLGVFYVVDRHLSQGVPAQASTAFRVTGLGNVLLVLMAGAAVVCQPLLPVRTLHVAGEPVQAASLVAVGACLLAAAFSLWRTPFWVREANGFRWEPMHEVAVLFAGLFVTAGPVLVMLGQGAAGPLAPLLRLTHDAGGAPVPWRYFWCAGLLSAFLDSAPAYLVFFQQAGGDAATLMARHPATLAAISAGSVLFGGLSYLGNAPNMMLRSMAEHQAVRMPGFFTYIGWAALLLAPGLVVISVLL